MATYADVDAVDALIGGCRDGDVALTALARPAMYGWAVWTDLHRDDPHQVATGVTDDEQHAHRRVEEEMGAVPVGVAVDGEVSLVDLDPATGRFRVAEDVAIARREHDGTIEWSDLG